MTHRSSMTRRYALAGAGLVTLGALGAAGAWSRYRARAYDLAGNLPQLVPPTPDRTAGMPLPRRTR